jgi:hypothetical protein
MSEPVVAVAQPAEGVEALQDGFGELREVLVAAQLVEAGAEGPASIGYFTIGFVEDPGGLEVLDVAKELFPVEL